MGDLDQARREYDKFASAAAQHPLAAAGTPIETELAGGLLWSRVETGDRSAPGARPGGEKR